MNLTINSPFDAHLHLRQDDMLSLTAPLSASSFAGAIIMPNMVPPVQSLNDVKAYTKSIKKAVGNLSFSPYMTTYFKEYSKEELIELKPYILGIKLYPKGVTTNSEQGVKSIDSNHSTFKLMEDLEIPLLVHGETDGFILDREVEFLPTYEHLAKKYPKLKIVMEHISTKEAVAFLDKFPNVYATATVHHLCCTLDDLAGDKLDPHYFCKPIVKRPEDRDALLKIALEANPKLMFGSDSAPHPKSTKECCYSAAGVFSAPIAIQILAELFEKYNALDNLQDFISNNAVNIYGLKLSPKTVKLIKKDFTIPDNYKNVVSMWAGKTISWSIEEIIC